MNLQSARRPRITENDLTEIHNRWQVKFVSVAGTRPEFVQAEALIHSLAPKHDSILVNTGQHYDYSMSQLIRRSLRLSRPQFTLGVGSGSHAVQTARIMQRLERVLLKEAPDCVLVYGDTNSTLAGALTAAKVDLPVAHLEAGLRSFNRSMPEELNRVLVDHVARLLFCPTRGSVANLRAEGIHEGVHLVGDIMYDSALRWKHEALRRRYVDTVGLRRKRYVLLTLHRPSNVDDPVALMRIMRAVGRVGMPVIFPIHPRTHARLRALGASGHLAPNIHIVRPLSYLDFLSALESSSKVLTDSGGVQKQAYFFGVPCVTLRGETEWVETVEAGWNILVGGSARAIVGAVKEFRPSGPRPRLYGNGRASSRIVRILERGF